MLKEHDISGSIEALTEGEARSLLRFKTLDSLRNRITEEMEQRNSTVSDERQGASAPISRLEKPSAHYEVGLLFQEETLPSLTKKEILLAFPFAKEIVSDGNNHVVSAGNYSFSVRSVHRITPDKTAFEIAYGRAISEVIGGGQKKNSYIDCGQDIVTWCFW